MEGEVSLVWVPVTSRKDAETSRSSTLSPLPIIAGYSGVGAPRRTISGKLLAEFAPGFESETIRAAPGAGRAAA